MRPYLYAKRFYTFHFFEQNDSANIFQINPSFEKACHFSNPIQSVKRNLLLYGFKLLTQLYKTVQTEDDSGNFFILKNHKNIVCGRCMWCTLSELSL